MAVGALEPQFYAALLAGLGLDPAALPDRARPENWPALREIFARCFATRPRDDWAALLEATDACATPVLSLAEARAHPQNAARGTYLRHEGRDQPAPAPRLSRTPGAIGAGSGQRRIAPAEALARWGASAP